MLLRLRRMIAWHRLKRLSPGSTSWFIEAEIKFGGLVTNIVRNRLSPHDPRYSTHVGTAGMTGGDRMAHHGYAPKYAEYIAPYLKTTKPPVVMEIGILRGTGLAMWADLFPQSRVIGLDIDLTHVRTNLANLHGLGAFTTRDAELYEFDQFEPNRCYLGRLLDGDRVDICIDDGVHTRDAILTTLESVLPHMNDRFVYFIEDNDTIFDDVRTLYPAYRIEKYGELTILSRSPSS